MRQTHQQLTPTMKRSTPGTMKLSQLKLRPTHTQETSPTLPYRVYAEKVFHRNQQNTSNNNKPVETRRITYFENRQTTDNTNQPDSRPLSTQPILNKIVTNNIEKTTPIIILPAQRNNNNRGATKFPLTSPSNPLLDTTQKQNTQSRSP